MAETLVIGYQVNTTVIRWPLWLAVGASGGFLMAWISSLIHFCVGLCRRRRPPSPKHFELKTDHF